MSLYRNRAHKENLSIIILFCFLLLLPAVVKAECSISEGIYQNYPSLVMENGLVKVTLVPAIGGRIAEYILKPSKVNQLLSFSITKSEIVPGVSKTATNFGGYEDRFWKLSTSNNISPYQAEVLEKTSSQIAVKVWWENESQKIERIMSLSSGSTELKMEVRVTNKSSNSVSWQYWAHARVNVGGDFSPRSSDWVYAATSVSGNKAGLRRELVIPGHFFVFETPGQGWIAAIDKAKKTVLGFVTPLKELQPDGHHYCWSGKIWVNPALAWPPDEEKKSRFMSLQEIYGTRLFQPGQTHVYHLSMVGFQEIDELNYLSTNMALHLNIPKTNFPTGKLKIPFIGKIAFSKVRSRCKMELFLVDNEGRKQAFTTFEIEKAQPLKPFEFQGVFHLRAFLPGDYTITGVLKSSQGTKLEEFELVEPKIKI